MVGGFLDQAHGPHGGAAQSQAGDQAEDEHEADEDEAGFGVALHDLAYLAERGADHDVERAEDEFAHAQFADPGGLDGEDPFARDVRQGLSGEVVRGEEHALVAVVDLHIEEDGRHLGGAAHPLLDLGGGQAVVVGPEAGLGLPEFGGIQEVEPVDQVLVEQVIPGDEQADEGGGGDARIPQRQPRPDRLHGIIW